MVILTMNLKRGGLATISGPLTQSTEDIKVAWRLSDEDGDAAKLQIGVTSDYQVNAVKFDGEDRFNMTWRKTTPLVFTRVKSEATTP